MDIEPDEDDEYELTAALSRAAKALGLRATAPRYWHGTTAATMRLIEAIGHLKAPVYLADSPETAQEFAEMASDDAHDRPLVLEVVLPEDRIGRLRADAEFDDAPGNFVLDEDVPLEWIPWYPDPDDPDPTGRPSRIASALSAAAEAIAPAAEPTPGNIKVARLFVLKKWRERAVEMGRPEPKDAADACKFASMFAQRIFGADIRGNQDHQYAEVGGAVIELAVPPDGSQWHDDDFFGNPEHEESMASCTPRVDQWEAEFRAENPAMFGDRAARDIEVFRISASTSALLNLTVGAVKAIKGTRYWHGSPKENTRAISAAGFVDPSVPAGAYRAIAAEHAEVRVARDKAAAVEAWHGTDTDFTEFSMAYWHGQLGFHFGTKEQASTVFGEGRIPKRLIRVELDIENPLRMSDLGGWIGYESKAAFEKALDTSIPGSGSRQEIVRAVRDAGYDSIVYANKFEGDGDSYIVFDISRIRIIDPVTAALRAARALGEHLGDTVTAYRALAAEHAEKVMREGFTGSHHTHGVYYTASQYRAMFYSRFMASSAIQGVIFELEADTSRSTADVNDTTEWQSNELYDEVRSAAGDMVQAVYDNADVRLQDGDAARQLESWLGGLVVSEGFYDAPTQHSVWQLLADETKGTDDEMTIADAREALPPGRYGEMTVLDSRGVAGIDVGDMDGQAQAVSHKGIPVDRLKAIWLPTALLDAAGEDAPAGAEMMRDYVDIIPVKFDADYDSDFISEIEKQRDQARDKYESDAPDGMTADDETAWYDGQDEVADEMDSILGRWRDENDSSMSGHIYSKLSKGETVTPGDLAREEGFVRYPLPEGRLAAMKVLRKAIAASVQGQGRRPDGDEAIGRAAGVMSSALHRAAEDIGWSEESDVDSDSFVDEGFVEDESGHAFWGSQGSGCLFVRNHPEEGWQLLLVKRSSAVEEPNTWGTTGGAVPKGESNLFASAVRETREEIGGIPPYEAVRQYVWKAPGGSFTYTTFILECTDMDWLPTVFNWEATAARWVSLEETVSYDLHFGLQAILSDLRESIFPKMEDDA